MFMETGQDPKTHPQNSENVVGSGPFSSLNSNQVSILSWKDLMIFSSMADHT